MLPDVARAVAKAEKKCPTLIKKTGWAVALFFAIMIIAVGFNGFLMFIGGVLFIIVLQLVGIFRYIVNENARAKTKCEELEREAQQVDEDHTEVTV